VYDYRHVLYHMFLVLMPQAAHAPRSIQPQ
jgi:hypothetical protein